MRKNIGSFVWTSGSINDGIRKILIDLQLPYYNTLNGDIIVNGAKVEHEKIGTLSDGMTVNVFLTM